MSGHEYEIGALLRVIVAEHYPCCVRRGKAEALADELADDLRPYVARVAATARADALTEAADALNVEGLSFKSGGWGSNPADQQTLDALNQAVHWLRARAAAGEGTP